MHPQSHAEMKRILTSGKYDNHFPAYPPIRQVLDVGSLNVNGTYRDIFPDSWEYFGADIAEGSNVDIVMSDAYHIPAESGRFPLIISGQCWEHCENPFRLCREMTRLLKPGGVMIVTAPFRAQEHRYPIDCFRFLPDGFKAIFKDSGLVPDAAYIINDGRDCWGIAVKPGKPENCG